LSVPDFPFPPQSRYQSNKGERHRARKSNHYRQRTCRLDSSHLLRQSGIKALVFEGAVTEENRMASTLPLGQLALTTEVENFPGFPSGDLTAYLDSSINPATRGMMAPHKKEGASGPELMELMRQQAVNFGTRIITEDIVDVNFDVHPFQLTASDGKIHETLAVIVATGARANYLGLPSEEAFKNRGRERMCRLRRGFAAVQE